MQRKSRLNRLSKCHIEGLESRRLFSGGALDTNFSTDGLAVVTQSGLTFNAADIAVRSDNKIIVAGTATLNSNHNITYFAVARFNSNGVLDTSFGSAGTGIVVGNIPGHGAAVALQSDNKIVVVGTNQSQTAFEVLRFTVNGTLDTTFNKGGIVVTSFGSSANAADVAIQKDGKIVVGGSAFTGTLNNANFDAAVVRYNTNGTLDTNFGDSGKTLVGLGDREYGNALTLDYVGTSSNNPDYGKIVLVGAAANAPDTQRSFLVARLQTNGKIDTSFHHTGKFSTPFVSEYKYSDARGVVVESNNKIVIVGSVGPTSTSNHNFGIIRLNHDGSGDSTFGPSNGQTEVDFGANDAADSVVISQTGELLVGGISGSKAAIVALTSNGLVDKVFGPSGNGKVTTAGTSGTIYAGGIARSPGGTFVIAGGNNFATERYFDRAPSTVTITALDPNAYEAGKNPATFEFSRPEDVATATRIYFTTAGTATSPFTILHSSIDYTGITPVPLVVSGGSAGTVGHSPLNTAYVDIPAHQKSGLVTIVPIDDSRVEGDETVIFNLAPDPFYDIAIGGGSATAIIHDNDGPVVKTFTSTADAYVKDGTDAGNNFGTGAQLAAKKSTTAGNTRQAYLKFDLSSINTANSVKLNLFGALNNTDQTNLLTQLFAVADTSWSETGITFNNKPAAGTTVLASATILNTTQQIYTFDVTAYVKAQLAAGHKTVSFVLKNPSSSSPAFLFNSREAGSNKPTLTVS